MMICNRTTLFLVKASSRVEGGGRVHNEALRLN